MWCQACWSLGWPSASSAGAGVGSGPGSAFERVRLGSDLGLSGFGSVAFGSGRQVSGVRLRLFGFGLGGSVGLGRARLGLNRACRRTESQQWQGASGRQCRAGRNHPERGIGVGALRLHMILEAYPVRRQLAVDLTGRRGVGATLGPFQTPNSFVTQPRSCRKAIRLFQNSIAGVSLGSPGPNGVRAISFGKTFPLW